MAQFIVSSYHEKSYHELHCAAKTLLRHTKEMGKCI